MVALKELTFFGRCLSKCMAQVIAKNHHQVLQRISHYHLHFLIRVKKGNQVLKKKQNLPVWENRTVRFGKPDCPVFQTELFGFGRIETSLTEEDDCSTSSFDDDDDDDDDDTNDEYDE
jgi:hypothetical protein